MVNAVSTTTLTDPTQTAPTGWAVIAPLTTIFTPDPRCPPIMTFPVTTAPWCTPPHYHGVWYWDGYYSPGICPSGYVITALYTTAAPENAARLKPSETLAFCVPSFWTLKFETSSSMPRYAVAVTPTGPGHSGSSSVGNLVVSVPALPIRWVENDLWRLETHPLSATLTGTDPGLQLTTRTSSAESTPRTDSGLGNLGGELDDAGQLEVGGSGQQGLSEGAIAGIAIGVLALFIGLAFGLFIRRRSRRLAKRTTEAIPNAQHKRLPNGPSELPEQFIGTRHELQHVMPVTVFELDSPTKNSRSKSVVPSRDVCDQNGASPTTTAATARVTGTFQTPEPEISVQPWSSSPSAAPLGSAVNDMPKSSCTSAELWERQRRLQERRQRLMELERIEQEEEEIRKKLSQGRN